MKFRLGLFLSLVFLFSVLPAHAEESVRHDFHHIDVKDIPISERFTNFGIVYGTQWIVYFATQHETIRKDGSVKNFFNNPFSPHFDKDYFDYNLFKHTFTGQYYYLYYRTCGYDEKDSFLWAFASSLAFEMAVETVTERPSLQDIYQTPVYGTLLGMGLERISNYFLSHDNWLLRGMGYALNPFTLLSYSSYGFSAQPMVTKGNVGVNVSWNF